MAILLLSFGAGFWCVSGCDRGGPRVVVYTSVDQVFSEPIFRAFEKRSGIAVKAVFDTEEAKSTGVLNRLIAEGGNPQADVFWSGDPVRPLLLIQRGLVEAYAAPNARNIPAAFKSADGSWTGLAARARVLLANTRLVPADQMPRSIRDLADPRWRGQAAMARPLFGTTTMHVAALFSVWGEEKARAFLNDLKANQIRLAGSNGEVKRLVAAGEAAFGLTDTDDANEALREGAPVRVIYPDQEGLGALIVPTAAVLLKNGPNLENGKKLIDFLLSKEVEKALAESAAHMPLQPGVAVPPGVSAIDTLKAMPVDYARLAEQMERIQPWLREWAGL
ncbi:MAG: extracellular solute-binding protein [Planctomycetes bacterium]|nr:extracellular solute-binding protein [Planctomycetota bacterium]